MILVGDLSFLCSLVFVVIGFFFGRRKWRHSVARKEEIKRLMLLVSEENARAELEAATGYSIYGSSQSPEEPYPELPQAPPVAAVIEAGSPPARQVQHHCEVCLSPTTTRCKQCKAVRYCSRKCQIAHWREGHKDECHSYVFHRNVDGGPEFHFKEFKQDETQISQNVVGSDVTDSAKRDESHSEAHFLGDPIPHGLNEKNDTGTQTSDDRKKTGLNVKESVQSVGSFPSPCSEDVVVTSEYKGNSRKMPDINGESMKPHLSKPPASSIDLNKLKSGCIDIDEMSDSGATGSAEHLFSRPSTALSSDFWGGSLKPIRSKINETDEAGGFHTLNARSASLQPSVRINHNVDTLASDINRVFKDAPSTSMLHKNKSRELSDEDESPCSQSPDRVNVSVETLASDTSRVSRDGPCPSKLVPRKSARSSELSEDDLESRELMSCKMPQKDCVDNIVGCGSTEEAKMFPTSACRRPVLEGQIPGKPDSNLQPLIPPKELDRGVHGTNGKLDAVKEKDSSRVRASKTHLSSSRCTTSTPDAHVQNAVDAAFDSHSSKSAKSGPNASARRVVGQLKASSIIRNGSLGAESEIRGHHEAGSFSYDLFLKLYNNKKIEFFPCGLINCGNSCYANSVLQCLAFTPPLTAYFLQGLHSKACKKAEEWCFTCELELLVKKAREGNTPLSPAGIMSRMESIGRHLANGREEDAHEFLRNAIETMQSVSLKETGVDMPSSFDEDTTLLGLTFGGYLQSKIECVGCGGKSKQHDRIMDLTVEIGGEIGSLKEALRQFTRSEILDGENKYNCSRCGSYQKAKKKLRVLEAPNVLTIALKRFQSGKYGKLNKAVKFPDILNLTEYMSETSDKSPIYQLYGVVVHLDIMNATFSGHYVCYVKNNQGLWYKADDSLVQKVELEKVLSQDAYLLFYSRCSPRAPRSIRSLMALRDPKRVREQQPCKPRSCPDEPWNVTVGGSSCHCHNSHGCVPQSHTRPNSGEDSDSSFFSEVRSCSTDSSNGESTSTNDNFDQMLNDTGNCWSTHSRSISDSDTTSSSSSSSSSPSSVWSSIHPRHSPLANMDRYSSETSTIASSNSDPDGFWAGPSSKTANSVDKERGTSHCDECKVCSRSCKNNNKANNRLGGRDKPKGVYI